jgi:Domain of unknown function (DUF4349)
MRRPMLVLAGLAGLTALAAAVSCKAARPVRTDVGEERVARQRAADALTVLAPTAQGLAVARERSVNAAAPAVLFPRSSVTPSMLIRTAQASIEVDSLERALAQVRTLAARVGGEIANTTLQTGRGELHSASLELRIPAERFDAALDGLAAIGKLEAVNVRAEDVGEEFTDVSARIENARRLEARLIDLLATRTGKLTDVLEVERALARVREEIERYEGRVRYLRAHAALSTLTISVHEPVPIVGPVGTSVLGEAFAQAWRNFVALVALCIRSLGVVLPLGLIAGLAWLALRRRLHPQRG